MTKTDRQTKINPWKWVPTLYFAEGIPYVLVMTLSVVFYKRMGVSNADIALYTSWLYLPWVIKPLWSPIVDILKTKRLWIVVMQLLVGAGLAGVAFTVPVDRFFQFTLAFFWLLAFSSATHDIAADGFYMLALSRHDQAFFVGIRSTFYRFAMLTGQGLLVILAGYFESNTGLPDVEVTVHSTPAPVEETMQFRPGEIPVRTDTASLYFVSREEVTIPVKKISGEKADSIIHTANRWNIDRGFYQEEESAVEVAESPGWWQKNISTPLAAFLADKFAPEGLDTGQATTGNLGYTYFHLSRNPGPNKTVVLNFTRETGDKDIALVRDYRYTFNEKNWDKPAIAVFRLDPQMERATSANFSGLSGNIPLAWTLVFGIIAVIFAGFFVYHRWILPRPKGDVPATSGDDGFLREFFRTFVLFFKKKEIAVILIFLLVYRLGESQLVKLASPFLLDSEEVNGLGITTGDLGLIYGTIGMLALTIGGILGGVLASRHGLKYWLWWMVIAMNLPNVVFVFLSYTMPSSLWIIGASVAVEQFGYGFGFTAYMLYMIYISEGRYKTAHFAIATGFMALGMMVPGMISGWLQEIIGYRHFFIWVMLCTIPAFAVVPFLKIDPEFGKKTKKEKE